MCIVGQKGLYAILLKLNVVFNNSIWLYVVCDGLYQVSLHLSHCNANYYFLFCFYTGTVQIL